MKFGIPLHFVWVIATVQVLFPYFSSAASADKINAFSAGNVEFDDNGIPSRIEFIKNIHWRWVNYYIDTLDIMNEESLTLMARDEWSVYFCSDTSKILSHVIVNLFEENVEMYYHTGKEVFRVSDVAPGILHGWTLGNVIFGCHQLVLYDHPTWHFVNPQTNQKRTLIERHRDEWTVYLDDDANIAVRVDYHRKVVNVRSRNENDRNKAAEEFRISGADFITQVFEYFQRNRVRTHLQSCPVRP